MRKVLTHSLVILMFTSLGAARQARHSDPKPTTKATRQHHASRAKNARPYQIGHASWYGKKFHGKATASGEVYNMFQFTAAHRVLPLGTMLKVTNLSNGVWVIVRVNDRGPIGKSRIIDLSYGAAQVLGLRERGVQRVRLDVVEPSKVATSRTEVASIL